MTAQELTSRVEPLSIRVLLVAYAALLMSLVSIHVMFTNRATVGDEQGLYNAVYMYQHYGKVTYPIMGEPDGMTIHPPTHYFVVGALARTGLHLFHAAGLPIAIIVLLSFGALLTSRIPYLGQLAVLTGFTVGILVYNPLFSIRPDMHASVAWCGGLIVLEAARSLRWNTRYLAMGAFLIAYCSTLHYWALAAALVLPAYVFYILIRPDGSRPWGKIAAIAGGAAVVYVPWAIFFVIPDFAEIVGTLRGINATGGGIGAAVESHFEQLRAHAPAWPLEWPAIGRTVFWPVAELGLAPLVCAVPVLFAYKPLRGLALPGAILPLFVLLGISRKAGLYYIAPELTLYSMAAALLFFAAFEGISKLLRFKHSVILLAVASLLSGLVLARSAPFAVHGVTWKLIDWDVARAANGRILGDNALTFLNNCYEWYAGGASRTLMVTGTGVSWERLEDLVRKMNPDSLVVIDDAFANQGAMIPFPSFYADGRLDLRGFYFSGAFGEDPTYDSLLSVLQVTTRRPDRIEGFGFRRYRRTVRHYTEDAAGPWVFVTLRGNLDPATATPEGVVHLMRFNIEPTAGEPALYAFVLPTGDWARQRPRFAALGQIRDEVRLNVEEMPVEDLLSRLHDRPVQVMPLHYLEP